MRDQTDCGAYLPTPEEIAREAAELRRKHLAAKRVEKTPTSRQPQAIDMTRNRPMTGGEDE